METDHRSIGDLFYACCDEFRNISFIVFGWRTITRNGHFSALRPPLTERIHIFYRESEKNPTYHPPAFSNPSRTENPGPYPSNSLALPISASECLTSPGRKSR
ncbi:hypothetical protein dsmv_3436 [Desulfococcus multivorans DSM 2059]|uniref:Uncharacterized protein n=1 Tax=Desulfococcus multivorans DSM 2059 TaxID=1121405 RepID=S7TC25_DESML|nr:hypothetical protein dsmv_3436 [Desulfococcus multivorans DSM 2059]SKA27473.1 hypothetical protein SAMN02745446_03694 [Desulfococcus multivorans DSM 2059]